MTSGGAVRARVGLTAVVLAIAATSACGSARDDEAGAAPSGDAPARRAAVPGIGPSAPGPPPPPRPGSPVFVRAWGGLGTAPGQFVEPSSVELDSRGNVFVAGHEDRVQKFTRDGVLLEIWGTAGTGDGQLNHPHGLAIDRRRGDLVYVGDQENRRVQLFTAGGSFQRKWLDDGFRHIHDVGIDPVAGDIYVGDYEANVVRKFSSDGVKLAEIGGSGAGAGQFAGVWGISTDSERNVYVADTGNRRVQKLDRDLRFLAAWDGTATRAKAFAKPTGIFVDATDTVYVCDSIGQTVLLFDTSGRFLRSWDLRAIAGFATEPEDVVVDAAGANAYIGEVLGHRVLQLRQ